MSYSTHFRTCTLIPLARSRDFTCTWTDKLGPMEELHSRYRALVTISLPLSHDRIGPTLPPYSPPSLPPLSPPALSPCRILHYMSFYFSKLQEVLEVHVQDLIGLREIAPVCWGPPRVIFGYLAGKKDLSPFRRSIYAKGTRQVYAEGARPRGGWITIMLHKLEPDPLIPVAPVSSSPSPPASPNQVPPPLIDLLSSDNDSGVDTEDLESTVDLITT
mgnify:CR=1 FL=1